MLSGVCGGFAETYDCDPTLVRIIFVAAWLVTGIIPLIIAYIVAIFIIPEA